MSNGWDAVAGRFLAIRSTVGAAVVSAWAKALPASADLRAPGRGSAQSLALVDPTGSIGKGQLEDILGKVDGDANRSRSGRIVRGDSASMRAGRLLRPAA